MSKEKYIGIEIGGTKLQLARSDATGTIEKLVSLEVDPAGKAGGIRRQIETASLQLVAGENIVAAGVGFGGPVDYRTGRITVSHQVEGWEGFHLKEWLETLLGMPVNVDNDANVAALGEAVQGAGKGMEIVFYMTIGSGIGGGVVIRQEIYHGAYPGEVEIGHLRLNKKGNTLESKCSGWAVDKRIREAIAAQPGSILAGLAKGAGKGEARFLKQALQGRDPIAQEIIAETADDISFALSHVVHLFHPEIVVIGGGLSLLGDDLIHAVTARLPNYLMSAFLPGPLVRVASLGQNVVPIGALALAKAAPLQ